MVKLVVVADLQEGLFHTVSLAWTFLNLIVSHQDLLGPRL